MLSFRSVMALLAVLALSAEVANSAIAAPDTCASADLGKTFCLTCKDKAKCNTVGAPADPTTNCTKTGEACTVLAGIATCKVPAAGDPCYCGKAAQCDPYDPDSILICLNGGVTVSKNCSETEKTCQDGACVAAETTPSPGELCADATEDGFVVQTPICSSAVYCMNKVSVGTTDCASGQYFDVDAMECMAAPPVPCTGCGTGACPDKSDCSKWYICDGGSVLDDETCEGDTPDFDIGTNQCVASGGGTCTGNANCTYGLTTAGESTATTLGSSSGGSSDGSTDDGGDSTTGGDGSSTGESTAATTRPAQCTAANVGERYPYEGDCKKYWSCRMVGTGVYRYVEGTCLGSLVFNPDTGYCDTTDNVPGCVV